MKRRRDGSKEELYRQYPQLGDFQQYNSTPCLLALNHYLTNVYDEKFQAMWQSSLKMVTDLG